MKKYLIVFLITSSIFLSAFFIVGKINDFRFENLNDIQEKLSLSILSTEIRFSLLKQTSCENIIKGSNLEIGITRELNTLAKKIKQLESELEPDDKKLVLLRERYSLLQIKDYLLVKELAEKCNYNIATILYFYNTDCSECKKQSVVLDQIRDDYHHVRVYWLDASLISPATNTLKDMFHIKKYPALVVGEDTYQGFTNYKKLSQVIETWTTEHNALIETADPELVQKGIDFIHDKEPQTQKQNISFVSFKKDTFLYALADTQGKKTKELRLKYNNGTFAFAGDKENE